MTNQNLSSLSPPRPVYSVLGYFCTHPQRLRDPEITITEDDFYSKFHKIVFSSIYNIAMSSSEVTTITEIDIDNYLASFPSLYKVWEKHGGVGYVRQSVEHNNPKTFESNYKRLMKFSLLRKYQEEGFDVSEIFDFSSPDLNIQSDGMKKVDEMKYEEIIEHFTMKMAKLRDRVEISQASTKFKAADGLDDLLDNLAKSPEYGYPFRNGFYNALFRGMRAKKLLLRSADTGGGKTRQALADMCNVACTEIYDYDYGWVSNGPGYPVLFISTELEKEELQTVMLAFITGVDEKVIKDGIYSESVRERLKKGIEVLKEADIFAEHIEDFSIGDIEMIIERNIIENNITHVAFDYIQITPKLSRSMANSFGVSLREDQMLVQFSAALKSLASKYDVYITSSTQLNRSSKDVEYRDTSALRGGKLT